MPSVVALFLKPRVGEPMSRVASARGVGGLGLEGDANASASSPRQVLIAGADDLRSMRLRYDSLRANIVLDRGVHDLSSGDVLRVGSLWLRITMRCEACGRLNQERPGLSKEVGARRGILARVICDGEVGEGAETFSAGGHLPALSDNWHERVRQIVHAIPSGKIVSYASLAEVAGVQSVYCRALPAVLRKAALDGAPVHRAVPADLQRVSTGTARLLAAEGIQTKRPTVSAYWPTDSFYQEDERAFTIPRTRSTSGRMRQKKELLHRETTKAAL